jgi:8-oxo-dGTP pyrophosphatase MutT (NUDIX family)
MKIDLSKKSKREYSAGCLVFRKLKIKNLKLKIVFLLGRHSGYHKWVLPKGLIERGEHSWQTAVRETKEETGVKAELISKKPFYKISYYYVADLKKSKIKNKILKMQTKDAKIIKPERRINQYQESGGRKTKIFKTVYFYLAEYVSGDPKNHDWEMEEADWFSGAAALKLMSFKGEKEALKKALSLIS